MFTEFGLMPAVAPEAGTPWLPQAAQPWCTGIRSPESMDSPAGSAGLSRG